MNSNLPPGVTNYDIEAQVGDDLPDQLILILPNGYTLWSSGNEYELGATVIFRDTDEREVVFWDSEEWREDPEGVMGAILACIQNPIKLETLGSKETWDV